MKRMKRPSVGDCSVVAKEEKCAKDGVVSSELVG
jgi:hypothetical protein